MAVIDYIKKPKQQAAGFTRWWWFGCSVTKHDIDRQLEAMKEAGIGGVELQILYPLSEDKPEDGIKHIDFYSPEFFEMMNYTLEKAGSLNIEVDFTLGSGWPFGGSFVNMDEAPEILIPYSHDVKGPTEFSYDYTCVLAGRIERVVMVEIKDGVMLAETAKDITERVSSTWIYSWEWGKKLNKVSIPKGNYKIYTFVVSKYRQPVGIPTGNMNGYAIDHCRKDISDMYFKIMGDELVKRLGNNKFRSFFCDSIELGANNWTGIMLSEFKKRRGYELSPFMPALWAEMGEEEGLDITGYIRYDYFKTFSELTIEGFFENFTQHCEKWGVQARVQAHGTWADILKAYGVSHIPEGETFGEHDCTFLNTIHRRLAQAAGVVYNRPIVSNESFTWLRMPRFLVTPEMIKRSADGIFTDGINHIINHGWAYSPESAGKPGWAFYASTMISMNNTWWEFYPHVSKYIHKISSLMQAGPVVSEIGVYLPQPDIWADTPMSELHMAMKIEEYLGRETVNKIQNAGHWFTYLNDEAITDIGEISGNGLTINGSQFKVIVLIGIKRVTVPVAERLRAFVEGGGTLICSECLPLKATGYLHRTEDETVLSEIFHGLFDQGNTGKGRAAFCEDRGEGLLKLLDEMSMPLLKTENDLGYIVRNIDGKLTYFIANITNKELRARFSLPSFSEDFTITELTNDCEILPEVYRFANGRLELSLAFRPNMSIMLVFGEKPLQAVKQPVLKEVMELEGWSLRINGEFVFESEAHPLCWEGFEKTKYYCGEGVYNSVFELNGNPEGLKGLILKLEELHCCAQVTLNGSIAGDIWRSPLELDISDYVQEGKNEISIRVVNTWINDFLNPDREEGIIEDGVIDGYPYFSKIINDTRKRRLYGHRERSMGTLSPSGLCGRVTLLKKGE